MKSWIMGAKKAIVRLSVLCKLQGTLICHCLWLLPLLRLTQNEPQHSGFSSRSRSMDCRSIDCWMPTIWIFTNLNSFSSNPWEPTLLITVSFVSGFNFTKILMQHCFICLQHAQRYNSFASSMQPTIKAYCTNSTYLIDMLVSQSEDLLLPLPQNHIKIKCLIEFVAPGLAIMASALTTCNAVTISQLGNDISAL